jgi:hypothetical protein
VAGSGRHRLDYTIFGQPANLLAPDAEVVPLALRSKFAGSRWLQHWTINGKSFPKTDPILVKAQPEISA